MPQTMSRGCSSLSFSAPKPSRSVAPGARLWTKTSARPSSRSRTLFAPSSLRFSVRDSLERLSQTKWLAMPFTVVSYPLAKSPTPGRSTFITLAPRSASWRVAKGAATACSSATTVMPSSGSILEGPRQSEDMLGDVGEDEVRGDGRDLEEPRLAELPLDVVLGVEAVAAEGLHRDVRRLPGCLRGEQERHVHLSPAGLAAIELLRRPEAHQVGGLHPHVRLRYGKLDALVLPYRAPEDLAFLGPLGGLVDEPPPVADALAGDEDPLGVHAVQDVAEALALLPDQGARRDAQVLEEELVGLVVDHDPPGLYREPAALRLVQGEEEDREPLGLTPHLLPGRRPSQQDHVVGVLHAGDVDLAPVDDVVLAVGAPPGRSPQGGRVGPSLRLRHAEGLQANLAARYLGQVLPLLLLGAVPEQGSHRVHLRVGRLRVPAGAVDLLEYDGGLGEAKAHPPVLPGNERPKVAGFRHGLDERLRIFALFVQLAPVALGERLADLSYALPDLFARHSGMHLVLLARYRTPSSRRGRRRRLDARLDAIGPRDLTP